MARYGMVWQGMDKQTWQNLVSQKGWWEAYSIYLSSPDWKNKREKRLKIDQNECRTCGNKENLQIHHKPQSYQKIPNESVNNDLTTLCETCHEAITNSVRHRRYQSRDIKIQNYSEPREAQKELTSYGMENREISVNECLPPDYAQWRFSQSVESDCEGTKEDFWQAQENRGRFRGIGPA